MTAELTLREYLDILRRRAWLVALCLVGAMLLAVLWSAVQTPLYESSARVLINQATSTDIFDPASGSTTNTTFADRQAATAVQLIESQLVDDEAESRLGFEAKISASAAARADIVELSATDADPALAQLVAQTYADTYLDIRRTEFTEERLETAEDLLVKIAELDEEIAALGDGPASIRQQTLRDDLADSYDRLVISASLGNSGSARIIDQAEVPDNPISPRTNRNLVLGGVLGLMLGAGGALVLESLDTSIKTRQVIESITPGIPALASIPAMRSDHKVIALERPDGLETEVFRTLRASIEFAAVDRPINLIQVTSAGASAGKTTVAANLAVVMAQSGQRVAVIDGDLRRPRIHTVFDIDQAPGISSLMIGRASAAEASHSLELNNGRLRVFPSGPIPPGPSELLGSARAQATLAGLRQSVDIVIIDSPPVLPVADALVISRMVDATIVVANARSTKREELIRATAQLDQAGANVIGTVLNQVKANASHGYGYGYGYGYGEGTGTKPGFFGRSAGKAPRIEGTAVFESAELPRFQAARPSSLQAASTNGNGTATGDEPGNARISARWLESEQRPSDTSNSRTASSKKTRDVAGEKASRAEKRRQATRKATKPKTTGQGKPESGKSPETGQGTKDGFSSQVAAAEDGQAKKLVADKAPLLREPDGWGDEFDIK